MKRCVIVGAAEIGNYERAKKYIQAEDFVIYCDGGLKHAASDKLGRVPDLAVGDFDSYSLDEWKKAKRFAGDTETIVLPCEKDDTDTVYAMKEGLKRGFREFLFLGVIGGRLDHTLGNMYMLEFLEKAGASGKIADDFSEMELVSEGKSVFVEDSWAYFSLLNIGGLAQGVTIEGAKYPLNQAEIESWYQYGISNEPLPGQRAEIRVEKGSLLLVCCTGDYKSIGGIKK